MGPREAEGHLLTERVQKAHTNGEATPVALISEPTVEPDSLTIGNELEKIEHGYFADNICELKFDTTASTRNLGVLVGALRSFEESCCSW